MKNDDVKLCYYYVGRHYSTDYFGSQGEDLSIRRIGPEYPVMWKAANSRYHARSLHQVARDERRLASRPLYKSG